MKKQVKKILICLLLTICCLCGALIGATNNILYAVSNATKYTNVLYDLQTDENFDASQYEIDNTDYSLYVIQIAESNEKELFVYVYQPYTLDSNLKATSINISKGIDENLHYVNYKLTLLNSNGVFNKYKVDNFRVETTTTRYYDISSIFRNWNANYDESPQNDNTISEVSFDVSKQYKIYYQNNKLVIDCIETEIILIEDKFVGFVRYEDGNWWHLWGESACDRHFVAFSTNKQIDDLLEADVYYTSKSARYYMDFDNLSKGWIFGEPIDEYKYLPKEDMGSYDNNHNIFTWERIQRIDDFIDSVDLSVTYSIAFFDVENISKITEQGILGLQEKQWVLSFVETSYSVNSTLHYENRYSTRVGDVSILRLKFNANGETYNLGVIDNKQSGSTEAINTWTTNISVNADRLAQFLRLLLILAFIIILLIILAPFLPAIFNFIIWLFKGIWQVISAPFKALKKQKKKTKKGGGKK